MNLGFKKVCILLTILAALPVAMVGCKKSGGVSTCKNDADCRMDASGKEINGICYMGKCEECVQDSDCTDLKQCVNNRCLSACQSDADCHTNSHCERNFCVSDCTGNDSCPSDHVCAQGRCLAQGGSQDPNSWASAECHGLENIRFDFDSVDVKPEFVTQVDRLAACLKANPDTAITIKGHCDQRGTPTYNMALGLRRTDSVAKRLKALGIASARINAVSLGDTQPLVNASNEDAWAQNRRAEFFLERK